MTPKHAAAISKYIYVYQMYIRWCDKRIFAQITVTSSSPHTNFSSSGCYVPCLSCIRRTGHTYLCDMNIILPTGVKTVGHFWAHLYRGKKKLHLIRQKTVNHVVNLI